MGARIDDDDMDDVHEAIGLGLILLVIAAVTALLVWARWQ